MSSVREVAEADDRLRMKEGIETHRYVWNGGGGGGCCVSTVRLTAQKKLRDWPDIGV